MSKKTLLTIWLCFLLALVASPLRAQTISGSTTLTVVTAAPPSNDGVLSGCTYIGSGGCDLPAGWTLVAQNDFECSGSHAIPPNPAPCPGTLPGNQSTSNSWNNTPNVFESTQVHGGSNGFGGLYGGDGDQVDWILNEGVTGSFNVLYLSFWEYTDPNATYPNSDYYYFQDQISTLTTGSCGASSWPFAGTDYDAQDFNNPTLPGTTTWVGAGGLGDVGPGNTQNLPNCQGEFNYNNGSGEIPLSPGVWRQVEIYYKPNTTFSGTQYDITSSYCTAGGSSAAGCGNGEQRIYINGKLALPAATNVNLNGNSVMTNASVQAGGVITDFCSDGSRAGSEGGHPDGFLACPAYAPPPFHRYLDDIIVIKQ